MTVRPGVVLPDPEQLARALECDLAWLASQLGSKVAEAVPVSPLRGLERPRTAFRVTLADGRRVKLRRMKTAERAAELVRLLERLAQLGLPQPLLARDEAVVTEWIEGTPFMAAAYALASVEQAAGLLGRIHATESLGGVRLPEARSTQDELAALDAQLEALVESKSIGLELAARIARVVRERVPARALHGFAHGDFTAENLVFDAQGRLRVVDNEALHVGIVDLDLARTWWRWPLPPDAWRVFVAAHRDACGHSVDAGALLGWKLRTLVLSASYRVGYGLAGATEPLGRLRTLLEAAYDPENEGDRV